MKISQGHLRSPLSVSCPLRPAGSVGAGATELELCLFMNSRSFTQGFWCQLLSSPGPSLTSPMTGAAAVLLLCYSVSKSHKMFRHFDLFVLCHREYLLFFCHAAVISGAFLGSLQPQSGAPSHWLSRPGKYCQAAWHQGYYHSFYFVSKLRSAVLLPQLSSIETEPLDTQRWVYMTSKRSPTNTALPVYPVTIPKFKSIIYSLRTRNYIKLGSVASIQ